MMFMLMPVWPIRLRPTWSEELAMPFGYFSEVDISSSLGLSMP